MRHPIVIKLLCVAFVVVIMIPLGRMIFPYVDDAIGGLEFSALQAVLSATLGLGLYAAMFG
jgi:hypothetical protein